MLPPNHYPRHNLAFKLLPIAGFCSRRKQAVTLLKVRISDAVDIPQERSSHPRLLNQVQTATIRLICLPGSFINHLCFSFISPTIPSVLSLERMVQQPTCTGLRIRSTADCNIIFHAVTLGILRIVSRRLSVEERRSIQSGCVFVWEERSPTIEAIGVRGVLCISSCRSLILS